MNCDILKIQDGVAIAEKLNWQASAVTATQLVFQLVSQRIYFKNSN